MGIVAVISTKKNPRIVALLQLPIGYGNLGGQDTEARKVTFNVIGTGFSNDPRKFHDLVWWSSGVCHTPDPVSIGPFCSVDWCKKILSGLLHSVRNLA